MKPSRMRLGPLSALVLAAGCGSGVIPDPPGQGQERIVDVETPVDGPDVTGPLPAVGRGAVPAIPEGSFTNGVDLAAKPERDEAAWRASLEAKPHTTAGEVGELVGLALEHAGQQATQLDKSVDAIQAWIAAQVAKIPTDWGVKIKVSTTPLTHSLFGYAPTSARWLRSRIDFWGREILTPRPGAFDDTRRQGARLYCAAREANRRQHAAGKLRPQGTMALWDGRILGRRVTLLGIEPRVAVGGPEKYLGDDDNRGAEAFAIPLTVSTKVTPLRIGDWIPGLPEVKVPVTLVAADSEIANATYQPSECEGPGCVRLPRGRYHSVLHADAIKTAGKDIRLEWEGIELFAIPLKFATFKGHLSADTGIRYGDAHPDEPEFGTGTYDTRLLGGAPAGWPERVRAVDPSQILEQNDDRFVFSDDRWFLSAHALPRAGSLAAYVSSGPPTPLARWNRGLAHDDPHLTRALEDDDHDILTRTGMDLGATLTAKLGIDWKFFHAEIYAGGRLGGDMTMKHELRDGLRGQLDPHKKTWVGEFLLDAPFDPVTAVTVTPYTSAAASFKLHIGFRIGLGPLSFDRKFDIVDRELARWNGRPWAERRRLRLGYGGPGDAMNKPEVLSHLPQRDNYETFAADVDACLADPTANLPIPDPCESEPDPGDDEPVKLCWLLKAETLRADACSDTAATALEFLRTWGHGTPSVEQQTCAMDVIDWYCVERPMWQGKFGAWDVLSTFFHEDRMSDLGGRLMQCRGFAAAEMERWFDVASCDLDAKPTPWATPHDPGAPPEVEDKRCE